MAHIARKTSALAVLVIAAVTISGCALFRDNQDDEFYYRERPVEVLYSVAAQLLDYGQFQNSILYFREVERQHPYSDWARRSMIMAAYAAYRMGSYDEAVFEAERFISQYPADQAAPYAYYLRAMCFYEQIVDVGRDQGATEQARGALQDVARRYPGSDYARDAQSKLDRVNDHLAGKEMTVGRYYLRNGDTFAAIGRFDSVIENYQTTSHTPEALYRLVESYVTIGINDEANRNAAVLGANFPGSEWYADAYALMTSRGGQLTVQPTANRRLRNLFGLLPDREEPLPVDQDNTIRPPVE